MAYLHYLFNELQVAVDYFTLAIELKPDFELAIHKSQSNRKNRKFKEIFNGANVWLTSLSA